MKSSRFAALSLMSLSLGCHATHEKAPPETREAPRAQATRLPVRVFGALKTVMHEGDSSAKVNLEQVTAPASFGVGALSDLRGEVTQFDGRFWLSYPEGDDVRTVVTANTRESAALMVTTSVKQWTSDEVNAPVELSGLAALVERTARARGLNLDQPFPLRIGGSLPKVQWHVIDGARLKPGGGHAAHREATVKGSYDGSQAREANLEIVGFYSRHHQGVFTHHDSPLHLHVIDRKRPLTGHVDDLRLGDGAVLRLPEV